MSISRLMCSLPMRGVRSHRHAQGTRGRRYADQSADDSEVTGR